VKPVKLFDLCAGIGGFRLGLENAGHECVGWCEKDKFAIRSYSRMYNTEGEYFINDAKNIQTKDLPGFDVLTAGFPCQPFSIAGEKRGFEDTRGTLFFEIARIAKEKQPRILLLENVVGLLNHENGETFRTILRTLDELGYDVEWQVLNSQSFNLPQNRRRIFIVGHLRRERIGFLFPLGRKIKQDAREFSRGEGVSYAIDANYFKGSSPGSVGDSRRTMIIGKVDVSGYEAGKRVYGKEGLAPTVTTGQGGNQIPFVEDGERIRRLTPKECWRLQGFPDRLFNIAQRFNSDTQLYKQAGNAVSVPIVEYFGKVFSKFENAERG